MSVKGIHWEGNNLLFENNFFKQMALAHSIFTVYGGIQLIWVAFDMTVTVVPLKDALGWQKFDFWAFQKNN